MTQMTTEIERHLWIDDRDRSKHDQMSDRGGESPYAVKYKVPRRRADNLFPGTPA